MPLWTSVSDETAPRPEPRGRRTLPVLLTVLAGAAQVVVLLVTLVMGLGWGGLTYVAALIQAGAAFVPLAWLAARRRTVVVLVPVLSAALSAGLALAAQAHGRATACSDQERAAVQQLAPPPGTTVEFRGEYVEGCLARTQTSLSSREIVEHYEAELTRLGWQETPGRQETTSGTAAVKDGIHLTVDIEDHADGGGQTLELLVGDPATPAPCLVSTVTLDASLRRDPTSEVEPGRWVVFVSSSDLPASVVVRDASGAVVLERQAHAPPGSTEDLMQLEEDSVGMPTLPLDEGLYDIECRPGEGPATVVPLRVAWAAPAAVEREKSVVIRVFETPDHWR